MKLITIGLVLSFLLRVVGLPNHSQSQSRTPSVSSTPTSLASYKVVDIMPAFWQFWERSQTLDEAAKNRLFRELVLQPNKEVFEGFTGTSSDARLARYLVNVQPYIPAMRRFSQRVETELPRYGKNLQEEISGCQRRWGNLLYAELVGRVGRGRRQSRGTSDAGLRG